MPTMKKIIAIALLATTALATPTMATSSAMVSRQAQCTVADPTGTPLNIRTKPTDTGSVVYTFKNDTAVFTYDEVGQWVFVKGFTKKQMTIQARWILLCLERDGLLLLI
jgi:uncharacterized protein YgiM (DUF1202 family)